MKKVIIVLLATVMALSVAAVCGAADAVPITTPSGVSITLSGYTLLRGHVYSGINGDSGRFARMGAVGGVTQTVEGQAPGSNDAGTGVDREFYHQNKAGNFLIFTP